MSPPPPRPAAAATTTIHDLPDAVLSTIFSLIRSPRARNAASLACRRFLYLDRSTRAALSLRGNSRHLFPDLPTSFPAVTHLDLTLLSPWGAPFRSLPSHLLLLSVQRLRVAFPAATHLALYCREPDTLLALAAFLPALVHLELVRWHQRPSAPPGADFLPVFQYCPSLASLDLSHFYCWSEDLPAALSGRSTLLTTLNLLSATASEGYKSTELLTITAACPLLERFLASCVFDPRYQDCVEDATLLGIAANCKRLKDLHLVKHLAVPNPRVDGGDEEVYTNEDAKITLLGLENFFGGLPLLEELMLDVDFNIREAGVALERLARVCQRLRFLKLGRFHGVCKATALHLDGVAICGGLRVLSIVNSADLTDAGLVAIGRGCSRLAKFEVQGCKKVTQTGMSKLASLLRQTLTDVSISQCRHLDASRSLCSLEPIRDRIERLHIDCVWSLDTEEAVLPESVENATLTIINGLDEFVEEEEEEEGKGGLCLAKENGNHLKNKKKRFLDGPASPELNGFPEDAVDFWCRSWKRLRCLSLWVPVGELLAPLVDAGLESCPELEEIIIKVEGDCRTCLKPADRAFGLSSLIHCQNLSKMKLDCGDVIGYALTAPMGQMDLSLWERFYLFGIRELNLEELDYWPPQDRDMNQRSLSLPAVGLLAECATLRKLFIHGTTHEHFMKFLLNIPNLRDVQLREDYYPAPEDDTSTEMRVDSCSRFEDALNSRPIPD